MLTNSNFLGAHRQAETGWAGGIIDPRTHHGAVVESAFPQSKNIIPLPAQSTAMLGFYTGKFLNVASQDGTTQGIFVRSDGLKMYAVGTTNDRIYEYTMSSAFNINTASVTNFFAFGATVVDPTSLAISPDGTKLLVLGSASDTIFSYTFGTAWDVTSLSYDSTSFSVGAQEATPLGLSVATNGLKFWAIGSTSDTIFEYTMSSAWDISTASYASVSLSVTANDTVPSAICWNSTGTSFFVLGRTNDIILICSAPTPFTVSGASILGYTSLVPMVPVETISASSAFYFVPGTKHFYVCDSTTDKIYQFETRVVDGIGGATDWNGGKITNSESLAVINPRTVYFTPDGLSFYYGDATNNVIRQYRCSTAWTITGATLLNTSYTHLAFDDTAVSVAGSTRFWISYDGTKLFTAGFNFARISQWKLNKAWDINSGELTYFSTSITPAAVEGFSFSEDGFHMYYTTAGTIYHRVLSTAWDISTVTATTQTFSDGTYLIGNYYGIHVPGDGTYCYIMVPNPARIYKYRMPTPFSFTGMVFDSVCYIETISPTPRGGLYVSQDGLNMFITDSGTGFMYKITVTE